MKKTTKPNPLKTFNDNNAMAYKKAGGAMDAFKKSLKKADNGVIVDRNTKRNLKKAGVSKNEYLQTKNDNSKMATLAPTNVQPTGYRETELQDSRPKSGPLPEKATKGLDYYFSIPSAPGVMSVRDIKEKNMRKSPEFQTDNNMRMDMYKKCGSAKRKKK